jgi:hypothetical protein
VHSEGVLPLMRGGCLDGVLGLLCLISRWPNLLLVPWYMRFDESAFSVPKQKSMAMAMDIGTTGFFFQKLIRDRISACAVFSLSLVYFPVYFSRFSCISFDVRSPVFDLIYLC